MNPIRPLVGALAALAIAAPAAAAHDLPDAEIFATNNTAVITDPNDPRLDDPLKGFARDVERIIEHGGGDARGSRLLDGVFFSSDLGTTTFERSRRFDVDDVEDDQLHAIAEEIRGRFSQQSVLTFDHLPASDDEVNAIQLQVPGVTAQDLREGLLADQTAREELFGGSVTLDGRLLLVAELDDAQLARTFAKQIGGDMQRAVVRHGESTFVDGPAPVRVEHRTLMVEGTAESEVVTLRERWGRLDVELFANNSTSRFEVDRKRFDRVRIDMGGDELDTLALDGTNADDTFDVSAAGDRVKISRGWGREPIELDDVDRLDLLAGDGRDSVTVGDLDATDVFDADIELGPGDGAEDGEADRLTVDGSEEDDQISVSSFLSGTVTVLAPVFVRIHEPEPIDRLRVNGRDGDDIISASTDAMKLTLDGGSGGSTLIGGPGDDLLIGGDGFDDARGGPGHDTARLGANFDRFSWRPGDGSDDVDGGDRHDSLSFLGTDGNDTFEVAARGRDVRFTDGTVVMHLEDLEEIDPQGRRGADTLTIGDLTGTPIDLIDMPLGGDVGGDGAADRVSVTGTRHDDRMVLTGRVVVAGTATLTGLPWKVNVSHAEGALDTLAIDGRAGDDTVDTSGFAPETIKLEVN
jgi:hypothetical protein